MGVRSPEPKISSNCKPRLLVLLRSPFFLKNFIDLIDLLSFSFDVRVAFSTGKMEKEELPVFNELVSRNNVNIVEIFTERKGFISDYLLGFATVLDCSRYYTDKYDNFGILRSRAEQKLKSLSYGYVLHQFFMSLKRIGLVEGFTRLLQCLFEFLPCDKLTSEWLSANFDLVLVSPLTPIGSEQSSICLAAKSRGIKVIYGAYSWDNLTNKGLVRPKPDLSIVWNDIQRSELETLHYIPPRNIRIGGCPGYGRIIRSMEQDELSDLGVVNSSNPGITKILWLGSSGFIARGNKEVQVFLELYNAIRKELKERPFQFVIRPHPQNNEIWLEIADARLENVDVYPLRGGIPTGSDSYKLFREQLGDADIVTGINTSAMIEALLIGKFVYTFSSIELEASQIETIHFNQLSKLDLVNFRTFIKSEDMVQSIVEATSHRSYTTSRSSLLAASFQKSFFAGVGDVKYPEREWAELIASFYLEKGSKNTLFDRSITHFKNFIAEMIRVVFFFLQIARKLPKYINQFLRQMIEAFDSVKFSLKSFLKKIIFFKNLAQAGNLNNYYTKEDSNRPTTNRIYVLKDALRRTRKTLIMGDSVYYRTSHFDKDPRTLLQLTGSKDISFCVGSAFNLRIYRNFLEVILARNSKVDTVLIEINLRSFSAQWYLNPLYSFTEELTYLRKLTGIAEFFSTPTVGSWENTIIETRKFGPVPVSKLNEEIEKNVKKDSPEYHELLLEFFHNSRIDHHHELVYELKEIKRLISNSSINTLFYFTPINIDLMREVCTSDLLTTINSNIKLLEDLLDPFTVFNFLSEFESSDFLSPFEKTEHLNEFGRKKLSLILKGILDK